MNPSSKNPVAAGGPPGASTAGFFRHHGLMAPGVRLLRRVGFPTKAVAVSLAFLVPLVLLGFSFWFASRDAIVSTASEQAGVAYVRALLPVIDAAQADRPFRLVAAPARSFLNSTFTENATGRKREGRPTALIHADDAARLGVTDGGLVVLGNEQGSITVHARIGGGMQAGVVVIESIWPNADFIGGRGVNTLTSDDPAPPLGGAVFHDTAVWIKTASAAVAVAAE